MPKVAHKAIRHGGSYVGRPRPSRLLSPREKLIAKLPDNVQQVYWCIAMAEEQQCPLDERDLCNMTRLPPKSYLPALELLTEIGVIRQYGEIWRIIS